MGGESVNYERLLEKRAKLVEIRNSNSEKLFDNFDKAFEVDYAHNSTAIEGNTLTLIETKVLLEDEISVGNKSLRETEKAATALFDRLCKVRGSKINQETIQFIQPLYDLQDIGKDDNGICEMVIEAAVIYKKG